RVGGLAGGVAGDRRQQTTRRRRTVLTCVQQQERAGAVRVLARTALPAALAEQRGLLVAGDPGDRRAEPQHLRTGDAEVAARRADLRQRFPWNTEQRAQLVAPGAV